MHAASGKVEVKAGGKPYQATLKNGKATVKLKTFNRTGKKKVRVTLPRQRHHRGRRVTR